VATPRRSRLRDDEELAIEWLLGTHGPDGREYLKPGDKCELRARAAVARALLREAPDGYFTRLVAALIDPSISSSIISRRIALKRPKGTPVVIPDRRRAEIAAFMQEQLAKQKQGTAASAAQAQNLKRVVAATQEKFGASRSTVLNIWRDFRPLKKKNSQRQISPTK